MKRTFYLLLAVATLGTTGCDTQSGGSDSNTTEETDTNGTDEGTDGLDTDIGLEACASVTEEIAIDQVNASGFTGQELLARAQMYETGVLAYEAGGESTLTLAVSSEATTVTLDYRVDDGMCDYSDYTTIVMAGEMTITSADGLFGETVEVELVGSSSDQVWIRSLAMSLDELAGTYAPPEQYPAEDFNYMELHAEVLFGWEQIYQKDEEEAQPPANGLLHVEGELKESGCDPSSSGACMGTLRSIDIGTIHLD